MSNVVSFETAKRLKDAGFQQPKMLRDRSSFYNGNGFLMTTNGSGAILKDSDVFAPGCENILEKLKKPFVLWFDKETTSGNWWCAMLGTNGYNADTAAEACAAAWLCLHAQIDAA